MNILAIDANVDQLAEELKNGAIIVFPTETSYGLGCDATNQDAVDTIYKIKKRDESKPLLVVMSSLEMVYRYVDWSEKIEEIGQKYWPGALTCITRSKHDTNLAHGVLADDSSVAFRVTSYPFIQQLSAKINRPIVATSANISNMKSCYDIECVKKMFEHQAYKPTHIIDGGNLPERLASTIIKIDGPHVQVVRQGEVIVE